MRAVSIEARTDANGAYTHHCSSCPGQTRVERYCTKPLPEQIEWEETQGQYLPEDSEEAEGQLFVLLNAMDHQKDIEGAEDGIDLLELLRARNLDKRLKGIGPERKDYKGRIKCCEALLITDRSREMIDGVLFDGDRLILWAPGGSHRDQPQAWVEAAKAIKAGMRHAKVLSDRAKQAAISAKGV